MFHLLRARTRPTLAFRGVHLWGQYIMLKRASVRLAGGVIRVVWEDDKDADVTSVDFWDTYFPAQRRTPSKDSLTFPLCLTASRQFEGCTGGAI